ncbi:hypothetical protein ACD578_05270 [Microvirga sp. RSM25]|uniref:hypothetical protein n=1 Tax=Microvirga sp. RSM25 TaxID=3273802 RepID=UPI003850ECBD
MEITNGRPFTMAQCGEPTEATVSAATPAASPEPAVPEARWGNDEGRPSDAASAEALIEAEYDLKFELVYRETYHTDRAAFLLRVNKFGAFLTAILGTATVGGALGDKPLLAAVTGFVVTIVSTLELVMDFAGSARKHEAQVGKFKAIRAELARCERRLDAVRTVEAQCHCIDPVEAGSFHAVAALAWNAAYLSLSKNADRDCLIVVPTFDRLLRHVRRFSPDRFSSIEETRARATKVQ